MVRPDLNKWNQTLDDLRHLATVAPHARTRERFLALYMIASGQTNATCWAAVIGREDESVINWVHNYNERGPEALTYRRSGGRAPFLAAKKPSCSSKPSKPSKPRRLPITTCLDRVGR